MEPRSVGVHRLCFIVLGYQPEVGQVSLQESFKVFPRKKIDFPVSFGPLYDFPLYSYSKTGRVHTTPGKFENGALFLRLGPSTLIRHEKGAFPKRSSNRRYLKTSAFRFPVDGIKCLELKRSFWKTMISQ